MDWDPIIAVVSIIFGILVIAFESLLRVIVGLFFILLGIWFLVEYIQKNDKRKKTTQQPQQPTQREVTVNEPGQKEEKK